MAMDRDWSGLPCEILAMIFERLNDSDTDGRRIGAVCTWWRLANSLLSNTNPDIPTLVRQTTIYNLFPTSADSINMSGVTCVEPNTNWLIRVEQREPNKWLLFDPFSAHMKPRSAQSTRQYNFNLLDNYRISKVAEAYTLVDIPEGILLRSLVPLIKKVVIIPNLRMILVMYDADDKIALWSPTQDWSFLCTKFYKIEDIISHEGVFHAVDLTGRLLKVEPTKPELLTQTLASLPNGFKHIKFQDFLRLVKADGYLYLVHIDVEADNIAIYVMSKHTRAWEQVRSLADKVFVLADNVSFSLSASRDLRCREANCIYTAHQAFGCDSYFGHVYKVYRPEGSIFTAQQNLHSQDGIVSWPPPSWLVPDETIDS